MKRLGLTVVLLVVILVILVGGGYALSRRDGGLLGATLQKDSGSNLSDYSAVFLTNGQVYFGKIYGNSTAQIDLRDIYYLQVNQPIQSSDTKTPAASTTDSNNISLVKLGSELHGPNDRMHINSTQVLFTETLKTDSKVVKAISSYTSK